MAKRNWDLSPHIVGHYEVINTDLPILHSRIGTVDFRTITLAIAQQLYDSGTQYLKKAKTPKSKIK